ncbi:hypothetical protein PHLGIDRAFT_100023 [Phlebiopsis gigantea 11061_1 CR5-6]|uniref:DUS-like FMN-binding domain-containing protein n=1 Tax=Phlebiopsis gigantea (strain 11061_1 CR5-6) TaxID=745531 RepID=A0A0C3SCP6_PHLG1|nr:hypothetical protein PHLGIDRAFT_100023 [Phlebiopsis gigantea 11061_1 CR5-6]
MNFASAFAWIKRMATGKLPRRSPSPLASGERATKRRKIDYPPLTPDDYRNGVMLAPMVRSGALPTRLFSLKHGAKLVWGPEIVDKAILHCERVVNSTTGVVSYLGKSKPVFTCHPVEKPFLIYQIGSSDPEIAVQAARMVMNDVAGIDLNCGCPKPFSTHSGMGAALLSNPDLLCSILAALRSAMPPEISISAKIRLLPSQEDTLKLVERIVNTGVSCLTVHCRTRDMRPRHKALVERLKEIVDFVEGMGRDVAVIENGDCVGFDDAKRIRAITGAHSCMIATAAEANPTCFSPRPYTDLESTFIPSYLRVCKYLDNHWSSTKFCASQFRGLHVEGTRATQNTFKEGIVKGKGYDDVAALVGAWTGEQDFAEIVRAIDARNGRTPPVDADPAEAASPLSLPSEASQEGAELKTPVTNRSPDAALLRAPLGPANDARMPVPALIAGKDVPTPTPSQADSPAGA